MIMSHIGARRKSLSDNRPTRGGRAREVFAKESAADVAAMSMDKNVKDAMARNFKRQAKAQEKEDKRRENEMKEEQKRAELKPAKEKWTKTITTTASRKRAREKAAYAEEDLAGSSEVVWKQKGSEAGSAACAHVALRQRAPSCPPPTPPSHPLTPPSRALTRAPGEQARTSRRTRRCSTCSPSSSNGPTTRRRASARSARAR